MTISAHYNVMDNSTSYVVKMNDILSMHGPEFIFREIARLVAEKYVAEHYQDIAALINQDAIALLSVAEAGASIRETLAKKLPDKVITIEKPTREVWQRGVLGGLTRIK